MATHRYKFNPESLDFVRVSRSSKQKLTRLLFYFSGSIVLFFIYYFLFFEVIFDTPEVKGLKRQVSEYKLNYELFSKDLDKMEAALTDLQQRDDNIYRTIFEAEPIHAAIREAGVGGSNRYRNLEKLENSEIVIDIKERLDKILNKVYIQSVSYDQIIDLANNKEALLAATPAIQPIPNKNLRRTASGWGYRIHPIYKIRKFHYGMDFTAPTGTAIYSTGDGVIETINQSNRGYGNEIIVNHGFGYKTLYAHLSAFKVNTGDHVKRGDVIGYVGNSGTSTAPHLHYEVHLNNTPVDPVNYYFNDLSPIEYEKMIEISLKSGQTFD